MKKPDSQELKIVFALFFLSLFARLFYLWELRNTPFFHVPIVDEYVYDHMAVAILKGLPEQNGVFRSPLYPMFLAVCYSIFGHSIATVRIIQMVIGAVSTIVIYRMTAHFLDRKRAVTAAFIYALYWPAIFFQGELLIISIFCILLILSVYLFFISLEGGSDRMFFLTGLLLGLSAIARGTALLFYPVMAYYCFRQQTGRKAVRALALLSAATVSIILISGLSNYSRTGEFVLLSSNGAINLYTGNNPTADGLNPIPPGQEWNRTINEPVLLGLTSTSDKSRYWLKKSLGFIADDPGRFAALYLKKFYAFWNSTEVSNNKDIYFMRSLSRFLSLPLFGFGLIGSLAILSVLYLRGSCHLKILWLFILSYLLGNAFFFSAARYRMAVIPFLVILAAHSIVSSYEGWVKNRLSSLWRPAVILAAAVLFVNLDPLDIRGAIKTRPYFQIGQIYLMTNRYDLAILEMEKDLVRYPDDPDILNNLGVVFKKKGDIEKAIAYYERALSVGEYSGVRWNLGLLYFELKDYEKARSQWLKALEGDPCNPAIRSNLHTVNELLAGG